MKKAFVQSSALFLVLLGVSLIACGLQPDVQAITELPPTQELASPTCCETPTPLQVPASPTCCIMLTPFPIYPAVTLQTDQKINALAINQHDAIQFAIGTDSGIRVYQYTYTEGIVTVKEQWAVPSENIVLSVRFSPDGHNLAAGHNNGAVTLMEAGSGDLVGSLPVEDGIASSIRFNSQGLIACGGCNRTLSLWDSQTLQVYSIFPESHKGIIRDLVWSPDETLIATASADNTILIWDVQANEAVLNLGGHTPGVEAGVESVAWSPDGSLLASGGTDTVIKIWDVFQVKKLETLDGNKGNVKALVWTPDGKSLIAAGYGPLTLWNMQDYKPTLMEGHTNWVTGMDITPNGQFLISGGWNGKIIIWQLTP